MSQGTYGVFVTLSTSYTGTFGRHDTGESRPAGEHGVCPFCRGKLHRAEQISRLTKISFRSKRKEAVDGASLRKDPQLGI